MFRFLAAGDKSEEEKRRAIALKTKKEQESKRAQDLANEVTKPGN